MRKLVARWLCDEDGSEVVDYVLVVGLVILACIATLGALGLKILDRWQRILDLL